MSQILLAVKNRRIELPMEGVKKMYCYMAKDLGYNISRTALQEILWENGLIIKKKRPYRVLTSSNDSHKKSENLLKEHSPKHVFEVLVSDITYLRTSHQEYYMTAIMDLYARLILCYALTHDLSGMSLIKLFIRLTKLYPEKLRGCIFHSDRGSQYCSNSFRMLTEEHGVILSNSRSGNPYDNSCMERVFATLKNEYMLKMTFPNLESLAKATHDGVYSYNNLRKHMSLNMMTPKQYFLADLKSY